MTEAAIPAAASQLAGLAAPLASDADRAALAEVLARPEFRRRAFDGEALRRILSDLWDRLLESLGTAEAERYASLGRAVFLAAVAVVVLLAWRALRRRRRPAAARQGLNQVVALPASRGAPPAPEAAAAALARGDLAGAVRLAYATAAATLGARGLPAGGEALTGPELAAGTADLGFRELARVHDRTVFGRRPPSEPEARAAVEVSRRLARRVEVAR